MAEKILIVDDDLETLRLVGLMLQRQGYQIVAANNGSQALSMAGSERPDAILLDVMMPDMDGYEVTRLLRKMPEAASVPIMMFTAKSMVDDKVAGFEAGVDDYITKPVHPAELVAHIKALLVRGRGRAAAPTERGYTIGFVAARGGLGVSTLVLNLAIMMQRKTKSQIIAAEMRPGHGTWGVELGFASPSGLNNLLRLKPGQVNRAAVESELIQTSFGVKLLLASNRIKDADCSASAAQMESVMQELSLLASVVLADIGTIYQPAIDRIFAQCQEIFLVTEPTPSTVQQTRLLIDDLAAYGFGKNKVINVVLVNRVRSDMQLTMNQVQDTLGTRVLQVFPPAPEVAYNAGLRSVPMVSIQPDGAAAIQFTRLAEQIAARVIK